MTTERMKSKVSIYRLPSLKFIRKKKYPARKIVARGKGVGKLGLFNVDFNHKDLYLQLLEPTSNKNVSSRAVETETCLGAIQIFRK